MTFPKFSKKQIEEGFWKLVSVDTGLKLLLVAAPITFVGNCIGLITGERAFSVMFLLITLLALFELAKYIKIERRLQEIDVKTNDITAIKRLISEPLITIYGENDGAMTDLKNDVNNLENDVNNKKLRNIYMVEYSSNSVVDLIKFLIRTQPSANIYLLIQHPEEGQSIHKQLTRIWSPIITTYSHLTEFKNSNLKILCYKQRTSFRGRNFDNKLINIGWYIYKYKNGKQYVHGHDQPAITFKEGCERFSDIQKMFNDTFKNLWENGIRLGDVCDECEELKLSLCDESYFKEWCDKVSPIKEDREIETTS